METPRRRRCLCPAVCFRFSTRRVRLRRVSRDDVHRGPARYRTRAAAGGVWTPTRAGRAASSPPRTPPRPRPRPPPLGDAASARTRASPSRAAHARVARACEAPRMRPPPARRRRRRVSICRRPRAMRRPRRSSRRSPALVERWGRGRRGQGGAHRVWEMAGLSGEPMGGRVGRAARARREIWGGWIGKRTSNIVSMTRDPDRRQPRRPTRSLAPSAVAAASTRVVFKKAKKL